MKRSPFQTGRTSAYLSRANVSSNVDVELVTDTVMQVVVTIDVSDARLDNAVWVFAHAVDVVAVFLEDRLDVPFSWFTVGFTAAWGFVNARSKPKRKEQATLPDLPLFLGGSCDPSKD